jgi:hypothetical protein
MASEHDQSDVEAASEAFDSADSEVLSGMQCLSVHDGYGQFRERALEISRQIRQLRTMIMDKAKQESRIGA